MKYLIVGLGNIGEEYENTRHNIGFMVVDALVNDLGGKFQIDRLAYKAEVKYKGHILVVIKPTTYMNLSGKAMRYWLSQEKIAIENSLVIVDDIALDVGLLRMKKSGSDGGHNGLSDIAENLQTTQYSRLRFGIGSNFHRGGQVQYVLSKFSKDEDAKIQEKITQGVEIIKSFAAIGIDRTMNLFNNK